MHTSRIAQIQVAFMLLTRLPAGKLGGNIPSLADARWAFPLVGIIVGGAIFLCYMFASLCDVPPFLAAIIAFAVGLFITGALHEDGLADSADGLGGGSDKPAKLEIMKDSRIGSYGVIALVLVMATRIGSLSELDPSWHLFWSLISIAMISRLIMVLYLDVLPAARDEGLGKDASDMDMAGIKLAAFLSMPALAYLFIFAPASLVLMVVAAAGFAYLAKRQIGGQTGDICGAGQILSETIGLIALATIWAGA